MPLRCSSPIHLRYVVPVSVSKQNQEAVVKAQAEADARHAKAAADQAAFDAEQEAFRQSQMHSQTQP